MLSAKGLSRTLLEITHKIFKGLNDIAEFSAQLKLLPDQPDCYLDVTNGGVSKVDLQRLLEFMDIPFNRHRGRW